MLGVDGRGARLEGDVQLPRKFWSGRVRAGHRVLVWVHSDRGGVTASMHLNAFLADVAVDLVAGDPVSLVIANPTDLGVNAIVNHRFWGLLYGDELFGSVREGDRREGFVKLVRDDGRLDLTLHAPGREGVDTFTEALLAALVAAGGFLPYTDASPADLIHGRFGVSKKRFKQAVGALYRRRALTLTDEGMVLVSG